MERMTNTKDIVLARAHAISYFRPLFTRGTAAFLALAVALYFIGRFVWVAKVFENMPQLTDVLAVLRFFEVAFLHTEFVIQVSLVVAIGAGIWLAREVARLLAPSNRYA